MYSSTLYLISALGGVDGQLHAPAALPRERDPLPIVREAAWAPWPVVTCTENLVSTPGFDTWTVQAVTSR